MIKICVSYFVIILSHVYSALETKMKLKYLYVRFITYSLDDFLFKKLIKIYIYVLKFFVGV